MLTLTHAVPRFHQLAIGGAFVSALGLLVVGLWHDYPYLAGSAGVVLCYLSLRTFGTSLQTWQARFRRASHTPPPPRLASSGKAVSFQGKSADDPEVLVEEMLSQQRFALLLRPQIAPNLTADQLGRTLETLHEQMALVPEGEVFLCQPQETTEDDSADNSGGRVIRVEPALLDRYPVTNRQFKYFVDAGGYTEMALWDQEIWPGVFDFVDRTGQAGPKFWQHGTFPVEKDDHPVTGICWYEALAYARWVGKRLPTDAEWVKAGSWPMPVNRGLPVQRKYPWGDNWEPHRANIWGSGQNQTSKVTDYIDGASVSGVYGLIGNVWEWTADSFGLWHSWHQTNSGQALKSLRGGAFDTYFENQATCQFQSGDSPLARKHNIGFRCAVGVCDIVNADDFVDDTVRDESVCEAAQ